MSIDRRKPFALLQPNDSKPADAAPTTAAAAARLTISRPRRQMPAYHYHYQHPQHPQKRYATMIPGSSRSSATSSAESLYSNAARCPAGASSAPRRRRRPPPPALALEDESEKENAAVPMQVDSYEKPLPPRPPALALHIGAAAGPAEAAPTTAGTTLVVMMDTREDDAPPSAPAALTATTAAGPPMTGRVDGAHDADEPDVRRRASITDELEEAREEATLTMLRSPRTDGLLRCPRRGCGELLGGVRALTFHLHIHAVGAGSYACVRCGGAFESARDLARHACARRRARERLRRVVRAWTCLSPTNHATLEKQPQQQQRQRTLQTQRR
ncbi:hypothetical protein EDB86DRAFT_3191889 [Lactarius hatsudake]|nr:hypothetical protein EDB86DRAFT_3191889 [Lactarius hatsudake]